MKVAVAGVGCRVMAIRCENSLPSLSLARDRDYVANGRDSRHPAGVRE
jgi:hypothetical protein